MHIRKSIAPILLATLWISISEFVRNNVLVHSLWTEQYAKLGIAFPEKPINGIVWGIWSLGFAIIIYILAQKFSLLQTTFLAWIIGFVLMWLVIGNLGVLPYSILYLAIPLSFFEAFLATWIVQKFK